MPYPGLPLHNSWREVLRDELELAIRDAFPDVDYTSLGIMGELICHTRNGGRWVATLRDDDSGIIRIYIDDLEPLEVKNHYLTGPLAS